MQEACCVVQEVVEALWMCRGNFRQSRRPALISSTVQPAVLTMFVLLHVSVCMLCSAVVHSTTAIFLQASTMLDHFAIFHKGGALLWTLPFTAALKHNPLDALNALIRTCLLERHGDGVFYFTPKAGAQQALKWEFNNVSTQLPGSGIGLGVGMDVL